MQFHYEILYNVRVYVVYTGCQSMNGWAVMKKKTRWIRYLSLDEKMFTSALYNIMIKASETRWRKSMSRWGFFFILFQLTGWDAVADSSLHNDNDYYYNDAVRILNNWISINAVFISYHQMYDAVGGEHTSIYITALKTWAERARRVLCILVRMCVDAAMLLLLSLLVYRMMR